MALLYVLDQQNQLLWLHWVKFLRLVGGEWCCYYIWLVVQIWPRWDLAPQKKIETSTKLEYINIHRFQNVGLQVATHPCEITVPSTCSGNLLTCSAWFREYEHQLGLSALSNVAATAVRTYQCIHIKVWCKHHLLGRTYTPFQRALLMAHGVNLSLARLTLGLKVKNLKLTCRP